MQLHCCAVVHEIQQDANSALVGGPVIEDAQDVFHRAVGNADPVILPQRLLADYPVFLLQASDRGHHLFL